VKAPERLRRARHHQSRKTLWVRRVRARILANLGHYPVISGVVAALLLPGGFVLVPVIAWWHRRRRRAKSAARSRKSGKQMHLRMR
jgi:hypothetical protein